MQIKFTKKMNCEDGAKCSDSFRLKLLEKFGQDNNTWHFSCHHVNGKHQFWFYFYDKNGQFEHEANGVLETIKDKRIKKFPTPIPTASQIEDLI